MLIRKPKSPWWRRSSRKFCEVFRPQRPGARQPISAQDLTSAGSPRDEAANLCTAEASWLSTMPRFLTIAIFVSETSQLALVILRQVCYDLGHINRTRLRRTYPQQHEDPTISWTPHFYADCAQWSERCRSPRAGSLDEHGRVSTSTLTVIDHGPSPYNRIRAFSGDVTNTLIFLWFYPIVSWLHQTQDDVLSGSHNSVYWHAPFWNYVAGIMNTLFVMNTT